MTLQVSLAMHELVMDIIISSKKECCVSYTFSFFHFWLSTLVSMLETILPSCLKAGKETLDSGQYIHHNNYLCRHSRTIHCMHNTFLQDGSAVTSSFGSLFRELSDGNTLRIIFILINVSM